ncbi:MAG: peptidyl-prolyl cis-trans isomerase [Bacteroides sp.]|nr:peptidyl-prolyl cis-trans isomerase [Bacteroides sp.]
MKILYPLLVILMFFGSCKKEYDHKGRTPLVKVEDNFLYKEDLDSAKPFELTGTDSIAFAQKYIEDWTKETLLLIEAENNIPNTANINKRVEQYRKNLITGIYQQELMKQRVSTSIPEDSIKRYYEEEKRLFNLEHAIIKGLFVKLPMNAPQIKEVKKWCVSYKSEDLDKLEKYVLRNSLNYDYFADNWKHLHEVVNMLPINEEDALSVLSSTKLIEVSDETYVYILSVSEIINKGETMPYEVAKPQVIEAIINKNRTEYIDKVKSELYNKAEKNKEIKYYY